MNSPSSDRLLYVRIIGTAAKHAPVWRLGGQAKAVAIAELAEAADGRADLLAKCAGLALGYGERQPEGPTTSAWPSCASPPGRTRP